MPALNRIPPDNFVRPIGIPGGPAIIDLQTNEDFAFDPRLIPGAVRRSHDKVSQWSPKFRDARMQNRSVPPDRRSSAAFVAQISDQVLLAPAAVVLRSLTRSGVPVAAATKVIEVDPRGEPAACFGVGERPGMIAAAVIRVFKAETGLPLLSEIESRRSGAPQRL